MPRPNTTFDLSVSDLAQIEEALRDRTSALADERLALCDDNPAELMKIRAVEAELHSVEDLLGRLHKQKVFFRPKGVYVGG